MPIRFSDNVKYTATASAGNVDVEAVAPVSGFFMHPSVWTGGSGSDSAFDQFFYRMEAGSDIEIGVGQQGSTATTWHRGTVLSSTNSNSAVTFPTGAGAVTVSIVLPSAFLDSLPLVSAPAGVSYPHPTDYYVNASTGSDSNSGTSSGSAFATIQKAINIATAWRYPTTNINIHIADGTYTSSDIAVPALGPAYDLRIMGNNSTPGNVSTKSWNITSGSGKITLSGLKINGTWWSALRTSSPSNGPEGGLYMEVHNCEFPLIGSGGAIEISGGATASIYDVASSGGGDFFVSVGLYSALFLSGGVALTGTPAYAVGFAVNINPQPGFMQIGATFTGSATGPRYAVNSGTIIQTNGAGSSYLPGDTGGTATAPGAYL